MPIGYLLSVLGPAVATFLALWPRSTRGPRATPAFVIESVFNELPFLVFYWIAASMLLAVGQHDIDSSLGWISTGVALLTTIGLAAVVGRATRARPVLETALGEALGAGWRGALDPTTARQVRPRFSLAGALIAPFRVPSPTVRRTRNIAYGPASEANRLDVYRHRDRPTSCPTLVYFHPGGFFSGSKERAARPLMDQLVRHGWVCVNANYRLGAAGSFPNNLVDAKLVISWAREHADEYGADPRALFVAGGSAGGNLAAMCALTARDPTFQPGFEHADTSVAAAITLYGYYGPTPGSDAVAPAPGDLVRRDAPPFLVIHGTHDPMVPARHARTFAEQLGAVSTSPVAYAELPGAQHNFDRFASIRGAAVVDGIEAFTAWVRSVGV